jgi:hypothetical protein
MATTTASASLTLAGYIGDETLTETNSSTFDTKDVGVGKTVTVNSITLGNGDNGGLASNYSIATGETTTANITAQALTYTVAANNKTYDGNTTASASLTLAGYIGDETLTETNSSTFDTKDVGVGKTVTVNSITLGNGDNGGLASNYSIATGETTTANITAQALTYTVAANNKTYDGNTTASASLTLAGYIGDETLTETNSSTFDTKDVGVGKTVTVNSITLGNGDNGGLASNYSIATGETTTANITAQALTYTVAANNKTYDGNTTASASLTLAGYIGDETLTETNSSTFDTKDVGVGKTVTVNSITLGNGDNGGLASNYSIATGETTTANITAQALTYTVAANNKTYDGNTTASASLTLAGYIGDETLTETNSSTFDTKDVGVGKTVTVNSITLGNGDNGGLASNYSIATGETTTANITAQALTYTVAANNKTYDGNTTASASLTLAGYIGDETLTETNSSTFDTKDVGVGKTVTVNSITLGNGDNGGLASNYSIATGETTTANITAQALTYTVAANNKTYDGNTTASASLTLAGYIGDETLTETNSSTFDTKDVGVGKTVTVNSITLGNGDNGGLASNYSIATGETTTANITAQALTYTVAANNKTYDGNTTASASLTLAGYIGDETLTETNSSTFDTKDVGVGKTVTVNSITLGNGDNGGLASNYSIATGETTTANITAQALTYTVAANNKTYDGNTTASASLTLAGYIGDETLTETNSSTFDTKDVGVGKTVTVNSITLGNGDNGGLASNYSIATGETTTANITAQALTYTVAANNKTYDGNTTASASLTLAGYIGDETLTETNSSTFDTKDVGVGKTVTVNSITLGNGDNGGLASNYSIATGETTTANITAQALTYTVAAADKVYDASEAATTTITLTNAIDGDDIAVTHSSTFADDYVSDDVVVTVNSISLAGDDGSNYSISSGQTTTADITPRVLTYTVAADDKVYDAGITAVATITVTGSVSDEAVGIIDGDDLSIASTVLFADDDVANNITVTVTALELSGSDAPNYRINTGETTTADITPKAITVTGITAADNKVYDGTTTATVDGSSATLINAVVGDTVSFDDSNLTGTFAQSNVGTNIAVTMSNLALTGDDASNYTVTDASNATADITPKAITVTGITAADKVYDGTTTATVDGSSATLINAVVGDTVSFDDSNLTGTFAQSNVGTNIAVTMSNLALTGDDASNYTVTDASNATADITAQPLSINTDIASTTKVYDGNTSVDITSANLTGVIGDDDITASGSGNFDNKNVGTNKTITVAYQLSGDDAANYSLDGTTATGDITAQALTYTVAAADKVYDASEAATTTITLTNAIDGDDIAVTHSSTFADDYVSDDVVVTVNSISLAGDDGSNYSISSGQTTTADITPRVLTYTVAADDKVYDAGITAVATITVTGSVSDEAVGIIDGDDLSIASTVLFADDDVANNITVTVTALELSGSDAPNYRINTGETTTADITAQPLSINTDIASTTKVYDGNTSVDITSANLTGVIGDDDITASGSGNFDNKNVGTNKTITVAYQLSGDDAANYSLDGTTATGDITAQALTYTVAAADKVYDASEAATTTITLTNAIDGDDIAVTHSSTFADDYVSDDVVVTVNSISLAGDDGSNYSISSGQTTTADITPRVLTYTVSAADKVYDGDTAATATITLTNLVGDETLTVSDTSTFADKNVGSDKTVTVDAITLANGTNGGLATNYSIASGETTTADITAQALTATITAQDKGYDASNQAIVSLALSGYVGDETLLTTETTARFDNINVGERTATVTAITLGDGTNGGLASNYSIATGQTDTANITPALLTITAANAAKFTVDNDPEFTVIYNGFVGSEDSSDLTTIGTVARTDANTAAGTYQDVIQPSGYAAANYTFNYVNGDLTIVPNDGLIIDINLAENNISYGSAISYDSIQASYWDENTNQSRNVDNTSVDGSSVVVNHDGTQVSFVIAPVSGETDCSLGGCYSSSNRLNTGGYNLGAENNEVTVNDDSSVAVIGSLNVLRKVIDPDDLSISEVSKVYDGSTEISSVTASYIQDNTVVYEGDDLQITASGSYSSRHVGTNKPINIDLSLSGDDSNNYAFEVDDVNGTNLSLNSGTITQLDSVTWAGDDEGGLWSAADSWLNGAIPDNDNVALVTIPENFSTTLDADSFGTFSSTIVNSGTIILNNANNYELSNTLSGAGTIRFGGDGAITLSGNNSHTGITDITDSSLTIDHANALGSSTLASSEGSLSISSGLTLDSLTTTGALKLLTDVNTTNDQTYGGNVEVLAGSAADPLEINSTSGDITFNGTLTAGAGSKDATRSLSINSNYKENDQYVNAGEVTFNDSVGYAFNGQIFTSLTGTNFYNFDITGNSINLNADIMTFNAQEYSGPVLIGDNGENGKVRRLMSIDPSVTFNHAINDSDGTHTLIVEAYALSANDPAPTITANGEIGNEIAFATPVQFITGIQDTSDNNNNVWGTLDSSTPNHVGQSINIQGNTTTSGSTTFSNFTGTVVSTPVATTTNNYVGGNQMSFIQRLLQQIKQNSNSLNESSAGGTPVVEVGAVLEECEGLSDESECLTE